MREWFPSVLCRKVVANYQEGAHEKTSIRLLLKVGRTVMENLNASVFIVLHDTLQLSAEAMHLSQA
jgi:hypothetical protein